MNRDISKRQTIASIVLATLLSAVGLILSCSSSEMRFSSLPAHFVCQNTNTIPQLNAALGNPGEFCTIESRGNYFVFSSTTGSTQTNRSALANYQSTYLGLSGLIVGLPMIPEPGDDTQRVVCFDLACPNCYDTYSITKSLRLQEGGKGYCTRCQRTYDLNTQGIIVDGDGGQSLYRYRVTYIPYTLQVSN